MKPLETVWRELVQRRLLPVAIVLIAALAAIPFLLAKDGAPVTPVAPASGGETSPAAASALDDPIVSLVADGERSTRRRVLGASKNPFQPGPAPKAVSTPDPLTVPATDAPPAGDVPGTGVDGSSPPAGSTPPVMTPPLGTPPVAPEPRRERYSLTVRFGSSEAEGLPKMNLPRLKALPSVRNPMLVYLGLAGDAKTAVFMVDASVEPQGDGVCRPNPANCETIHLRVGDTEFFDVTDETGAPGEQFQLDLLAIERTTTASSAKAKAARAKAASGGRKALRARQAASGPLRYSYDVKSGAVRKLGAKALKAAVQKATATRMARAALASAGAFNIQR